MQVNIHPDSVRAITRLHRKLAKQFETLARGCRELVELDKKSGDEWGIEWLTETTDAFRMRFCGREMECRFDVIVEDGRPIKGRGLVSVFDVPRHDTRLSFRRIATLTFDANGDTDWIDSRQGLSMSVSDPEVFVAQCAWLLAIAAPTQQ